MNKFISRPLVAAMALLGCTGAMAATVTLTPYNADGVTPQTTFALGDEIVVDFVASGYPAYSKANTAGGLIGASLSINFSAAGGIGSIGAAENLGSGICLVPNAGGCLAGTVYNTLNVNIPVGAKLVVYGGDGSVPVSYDRDTCVPACATKYGIFTNSTTLGAVYNNPTFVSGDIANTVLTAANPTVNATSDHLWGMRFVVTQVPVPAAAWLFGSALGLLGVSRRRSA